jgi:carbonic anhydrase
MSLIKHLIVSFIFFTTLLTSSEAATWAKLNESKSSKLSIDKQSIIEQQDYKKAWAKVEYASPQKNPDSVDKVYNSTKALWFFDCKSQKSATTQIFQYLDQELVYSASVDVKNAEFVEPLPDSNVEIAMRYVCKRFKSAAVADAKPAPVTTEEQPKTTESNSTTTQAPQKQSPTPVKAKEAIVEEPKTKEPETEEPVTEEDIPEKTSKKTSAHTKWAYTGKRGPKYWAKLNSEFAMCELGVNQSPINIESTIHAALKPIRTIHKFPAKDIVNNGHTIQVNFQEGNIIVLDKTLFKLKQVHFHAPSENTINGKNYPLEAHFVHADSKGNLAVIAVMFKEGEANPTLGQLWAQFSNKVDETVTLKGRFTPDTLMPAKQQYYRFNGSLTTPPCSEGVRWVVMKAPMTVSREQIDTFERVIHHHNNRPIQPVNGRAVLE